MTELRTGFPAQCHGIPIATTASSLNVPTSNSPPLITAAPPAAVHFSCALKAGIGKLNIIESFVSVFLTEKNIKLTPLTSNSTGSSALIQRLGYNAVLYLE